MNYWQKQFLKDAEKNNTIIEHRVGLNAYGQNELKLKIEVSSETDHIHTLQNLRSISSRTYAFSVDWGNLFYKLGHVFYYITLEDE